MVAGEDCLKVVESTIEGFDELALVRYEGGELGTPSSSTKGTAMARTGVDEVDALA